MCFFSFVFQEDLSGRLADKRNLDHMGHKIEAEVRKIKRDIQHLEGEQAALKDKLEETHLSCETSKKQHRSEETHLKRYY